MSITYTPLPSNGTPAFGTQGNAVAQYQTQLNAQNAGQPGYVPLKVDGMYGPLTQAASQYKPTPTIGSIYNIPSGQDPSIATAGANLDAYNVTKSTGGSAVDENAVRNQVLQQYQAEVDATNAIFGEKLREAKIAGNARLGSNTAVQARRGLLTSDFGNTETTDITNDQERIYANIKANQDAAIQNILKTAREEADSRIKEKNTAIGEGLTSHLAYLKDAQTRKEESAKKAATYIYNAGLTPAKLTASELQKTADGYGVKPEDIKSAFDSAKKDLDLQKSKDEATLAENKKKGQTVLSKDSTLVNPDGTVVARGKASVPTVKKTTTAPKGSVQSGNAVFSPGQISGFSAKLEASKGTDGYVDPAAYQEAYDAWTDPEVGGLAKDFLAKYPPKKYVNPANNQLPVYLRSSTTKATATGARPH